VEVENTGDRAGEEVVELYLKDAVRSLAGFQRIALAPRGRATVQFTLQPKQFAHVAKDGSKTVEAGAFEISVGGNSARLQLAGPANKIE